MAEKPQTQDTVATGDPKPQTVSSGNKPCSTCGEPRPTNAATCPHCGLP